MQIELSSQAEYRLNELLATGKYASPDDAVLAALARLVQEETHNSEAILVEIQESLAEEEAGRMRPLSHVAAEIRSQHGFQMPE